MFNSTLFCTMVCFFFCMTSASTKQFKGNSFEAYVVTDVGYRYQEIQKNNHPYIQVQEGDEYSLVINNPLPVRVAVAVTIDGLNTIDGKRTSPDKAEKWMIDANSSITLRGWQTDRSSLRRFVFTGKDDSYASWKGSRDKKAYTKNLGVIGIAYFWNKAELDAAQNPPQAFNGSGYGCDREAKKSMAAPEASRSCDEMQTRPQAGTGMGSKEGNAVYNVEFHYDTGMYSSKNVLTLYYEFAQPIPQPQPFIDEYSSRDFAPEMP